MPDRQLVDTIPGAPPTADQVQQLPEAERGLGTQGVLRAWQASDSDKLVLVSDSTGVKISRDAGATAPAQVIVDGTTAGGALGGTYPNPSLAAATLAMIAALIPIGVIWPYAAQDTPSGWLICDGAVVAQAAYPALYAKILATYNTGGEGAGTFRLPDLQGRFPLGTSGVLHPFGQRAGAETINVQHRHAGPSHNHDPGSLSLGHGHQHSHGLNSHVHNGAAHTHPQAGAGHSHGMPEHHHGDDHRHHFPHDHGGVTQTPSATSNRADGSNPVGSAGHWHVIPTEDSGTDTGGASNTQTLAGHRIDNDGLFTSTEPDSNAPAASTGDTGPPTAAATSTALDTTNITIDHTPPYISAGTTGNAGTDPTDNALQPAQAIMPPYLTIQYIIRAA
jgi:microcystin-dependent protein